MNIRFRKFFSSCIKHSCATTNSKNTQSNFLIMFYHHKGSSKCDYEFFLVSKSMCLRLPLRKRGKNSFILRHISTK